MSSGIKILLAFAGIIVIAASVKLLVGHFHLSQAFSSAAIGIVIGVGVALGAFSLTPKKQSATGRAEFCSSLKAHCS